MTEVKISVFDARGRLVEDLVNDTKVPGQYALVWTPGSCLPSGAYFCRLEASGKIQTIKMVLVK
jgi:hypothetical protein